MARRLSRSFLFFFNDTATTEIYTLSLHDALPILLLGHGDAQHAQITKLAPQVHGELVVAVDLAGTRCNLGLCRSEEHTSELQSQSNLVCRLLLEKKKF